MFAALVGGRELQALLGGANVFDGAPRNAAAPYVHLGEIDGARLVDGDGGGGGDHFAVVAWSRQPGASEALAIAERVRGAAARCGARRSTGGGW